MYDGSTWEISDIKLYQSVGHAYGILVSELEVDCSEHNKSKKKTLNVNKDVTWILHRIFQLAQKCPRKNFDCRPLRSSHIFLLSITSVKSSKQV